MSDIEQLKAEIKKLNAQATARKMDLHDLSEELPIGWERIMEVAEKTYQAYSQLDAARKQLAGVGG
jgi:hypothetical protein